MDDGAVHGKRLHIISRLRLRVESHPIYYFSLGYGRFVSPSTRCLGSKVHKSRFFGFSKGFIPIPITSMAAIYATCIRRIATLDARIRRVRGGGRGYRARCAENVQGIYIMSYSPTNSSSQRPQARNDHGYNSDTARGNNIAS